LITRVYFPEESANVNDPVLQLVPADRRATLIAKRSPTDQSALEWNMNLQGQGETVFFDY
jgi:protocatechuate 3,4-dioxygenase alpha subunit